jgi:tetratricopeptide (TPR) repeat protein
VSGALEDVFDLQDQVASSVVGAVTPSVTGAEIERAKRKPLSSLDAYDYWLRGRAAHLQFAARENIDRAIGLYEQALRLDPQFALAHATLGGALHLRKEWRWSNDPEADASRAVECARTALALGTNDPVVLAYSAGVLMGCGGEVEFADSLLDEAIRLDPNGVLPWVLGGWAKIALGDHRTAIKYSQHALRLSPLDPRVAFAEYHLAYAHFFLGNYEEGLRIAASHLRRFPNNVGALRAAMVCNMLLGNTEAARSLWRQLAVLSPTDRVSETRKRGNYRRDQDVAKLQEAYRLAGMPE